MLKKRGKFRRKSKHKNHKEKIICYESEKHKHCRLDCPNLEKGKEKKEDKKKKKKIIMSTWEDLDSSSSDYDQEAHVSLMTDTIYNSTSEESDE